MKKYFPILLALLTSTIALSGQALGPHGGDVVQNEAAKYEVKIDPAGQIIEVFTLHSKKAPPRKMEITLFRESGTGHTISLKAVNLKDPLPRYQGELSPFAGSYVGAELRFEVSLKSLQVLKFIPNMPTPLAPAGR